MGITGQFERVRGSYGAKLAVALLVVVAVAVGVGAMVYQQTNDQLRDDVRTELSATADARAAQLDAYLDNVRGQTQLASTRPALASGDRTEIAALLDELAAGDSLPDGVTAVHYYDAAEQRVV
ncbi:methyl-accepting chemotaxis protein, partial [Halobacterium sp. CBA1126]|nr:methyl-accepting chemotaxis protein [Halobacterium sp. CBA1126]